MNILDQICQLSRDAGSLIMQFYSNQKDIKIFYKKDKTPITNVDIKANNIIKNRLLSMVPKFPVLSEESITDFKTCQSWNRYWLVDPLDGTKEFLKKNGEFTVNISLIDNGIPVLGVIYAPCFDLLYCAFKRQAWKESKIGLKKEINVSSEKIPWLISSRSHLDKELSNYLQKNKYFKIKKIGSSLKFCFVAEGKVQIYPRFGSTCIWDTAAGHAIVNAAGGKVQTWTGEDLNYSLSDRSSFINPGFIACSL